MNSRDSRDSTASTASAGSTGSTDSSGSTNSPLRQEPVPRDEAPQFVLPLVVRIERNEPPSRTDALETAARAVVLMLSDARSSGDGEWAARVRDWQDGRIRKVVRRARGAEWRKASELPGITATGGGAEVRVFPPVPLDGWPRELSKLQVSGTELEDRGQPVGDAGPGCALLWLNPGLHMSTGKEMAQVGHGAQLLWWDMDEAGRTAWRDAGFPLAVRTAAAGRWAELAARGLPTVRDAGFTEVAPGSVTVVAEHPVRH
ncbi:peptidyl-tRNA hydrolase [Streptomyces spongiicola]|uniref:peptidyl-tRNA hydrolase n=1 Tax=Streptomyces spongiicola TaxID=1690221 RepID=A0A388SSW3_9ACTN|nr:peptidyl-tRNA hydrolase [Streptomyces spongiicola]GBP98860.1 peptidyl-tRNA hydrolase [Streptomyces spongiicola]